jgi:hypothetical protein
VHTLTRSHTPCYSCFQPTNNPPTPTKTFIQMPRTFRVIDGTDEVRCNDPSCNITQCGQCNKEQNRRKRAQRAEVERQERDKHDCDQVRAGMQDGTIQMSFTYDSETTPLVDEANRVLENVQLLDYFNHDNIQDNVKKPKTKAVTAAPKKRVRKEQVTDTGNAAEAPGFAPPPPAPTPPQEPIPVDSSASDMVATEASENKTKWNHVTRTMLFRCIQKHDPFNSKAKAETWETIASDMKQATENLKNEADGDLSVHGNGRSVQMFYNRCRDNFKKASAGEKHSGGAGKSDKNPAKQEELNQLSACIDLEKCAKHAQETKREAAQALDGLVKGEVNDFVVDVAIKNEAMRPKLVKVLASRLREAKMRKMAFEHANKNAKYTYTATDMQNFAHWDRLKAVVPEVGDVPDSEPETSSAPRGGAIASAIKALSDRLPSVSALTPMSPVAFAEAFFQAKRASIPTLKQKLNQVDKDAEDGLLDEAEVNFYKKRIKDAHFKELAED